MIHHELSNSVLSAIQVHSSPGPGLLESEYEGAMAIELSDRNIPFERRKRYEVRYLDHLGGEYFADLVASDSGSLEPKVEFSGYQATME